MIYNYIVRIYPLFRVMEVQRTCEVTATPVNRGARGQEGASLSEKSSNKRI